LFSFGTQNQSITALVKQTGDTNDADHQVTATSVCNKEQNKDSAEENLNKSHEIQSVNNQITGFLVCFFGLHGSFLLWGNF
jgi:uncharacterized protein with NAD-binding domain and iron-sulfur cluster